MKSIKLMLLIACALPTSNIMTYDGSGQLNASGVIPGAKHAIKSSSKHGKSSTHVATLLATPLPVSTCPVDTTTAASACDSSKPITPPSPWGEKKTPVTDLRTILAESATINAKHSPVVTAIAQAAPAPIISPASTIVDIAPAGAGKGLFDDAEDLPPKVDLIRPASPALKCADYDSESEKSTIHHGLLPDINTQRSTYKRSVITGYFFKKVFLELKAGKPVDTREIEKAAVDARDFPEHYTPIQVSQLLSMLKTRPEITLTPATLGELHTICTNAKNSRAIELANLVEKSVKELQELKEGIDNSAKLYARMNGSCDESPKTEYGMGRKFSENSVKSYQQAIAKAFSTRAELK